MDTPKSFENLKNRHDDYHYNTSRNRMIHTNNPVWTMLYVAEKTQDRLGKILMKQPRGFLRFLKKNRGKIFVTGSFLAYMFSPQIGYDKHKGKRVPADEKTKKEFGLDSLYQTTDRETNTIVRLVSGVADSSDVDSLITLYGHKEVFDTMYANTPKDTLMYKCLATVLMSIHNPHMGFHGDYKRDILGDALGYDNSKVSAKVDEFSASMQVGNIKKHGVFADTIEYRKRQDSVRLSEGKKPRTEEEFQKQILYFNKMGAKYITNKIFAEGGHIRGIHREGVVRYYINYFGDYIKSGFKQKSLYESEGSQEYLTHTANNGWAEGEEGVLVAQFIKLYEENMPANDVWHMERLITFYESYFENYTDAPKAQLYREKAAIVRRKAKEAARAKKAALEKVQQERAIQDSIQKARIIPITPVISPTQDTL